MLYSQCLKILGKPSKEITIEGIKRAIKQLELNPTDRRALSLAPGFMFEIGEIEESYDLINQALELYPDDAGVLFNAACQYAKDGNKEKALGILEIAVNKGFGNKNWLENDPDYDSLRSEPRFIEMMNKLK